MKDIHVFRQWRFITLIVSCVAGYAAHPAQYAQIDLNANWMFAKSAQDIPLNKWDELNWEQVDIPHTPVIEPEVVNDQWMGYSFYKRKLTRQKNWQKKHLYLRFEAAMNTADVWINGVHIYRNYGGYLPFTIDATAHLKDENEIWVKLNNHDNPAIGPKPLHQLDFNTYGGLYRGVSLLVKPKLHITDEIFAESEAGGGVLVKYPKVAKEESHVFVQTHVANYFSNEQAFSLVNELYYENKLVAKRSANYSLAANSSEHFDMTLEVNNAKLWSPQYPHLYRLKTHVQIDAQNQDENIVNIGIREFTFNEKHQLLINGTAHFLRGVNRHQEYPFVGYAVPDAAQRRDAIKIKSAGFDYVRVAHYPMSKAFMQAADELGLLVLNAIPSWQYYSYSDTFNEYIRESCENMIRRDRNHPSVLAWECSLNETPMPASLVSDLHEIVKREMPSAFSAGWTKGYDIYIQARQHRLQHYEPPTQPYIVSEYGDWEYYAQNAGLAQDSWQDLKPDERNSRQLLSDGEVRLLQQAINVQEAHNDNFNTPAFADGYWVMFDYNRGYADNLEASGIMSLKRLPKHSYYFFQSQRPAHEISHTYESGPMVYIASDWNSASPLSVRVFSNAEQVELLLNGNVVSRAKPSRNALSNNLAFPPFVFNLDTFEAGALQANAYIDDQLVAAHSVTTPGAPDSIKFSLDLSRTQVEFGQNDLLFLHAHILDKQGNPVRMSNQKMIFQLTGDAEIVGPDTALTERGIASVLVRVGQSPAGVKVRARLAQYYINAVPVSLTELLQ